MTSETSQVKAGPEAVSTGIKEIIVPKVNGVYMLGELQHKRKDRRWSCGFVYYIGQSEDLAQRLIAHRGPKSGLNLRNCRMLILSGPSEHYGVTTRQRLEHAEARFISAALEMNLHLQNKQLPNGGRRDSEKEKSIITEALGVFHELTKTEWLHPDKFLRCVYKAAA